VARQHPEIHHLGHVNGDFNIRLQTARQFEFLPENNWHVFFEFPARGPLLNVNLPRFTFFLCLLVSKLAALAFSVTG
jgi:hypothetical protein